MTDEKKGLSSVSFGVLLWVGFCVFAVCIRGVRWEETYERAQVLLGQIPYPEGHPLYRYAHNAFTIQYYLSAAVLWLTQSASVVCGFRDVLALLATVLPAYLLTTLVSGRSIFGHVGAVFVLAGTLKPFGSYYPLFIWPDKFTSGHIGMGVALLTLYLLLSGRWRSGGLLLGLLPCIHIGQMPVLILFAPIYFAYAWSRENKVQVTAAVKWAAMGLLISAIVWGLLKITSIPVPVSGGYASTADPYTLWQRYTFVEDVHRAFPRFFPMGHMVTVLAGMLMIGGTATYVEWRRDRHPGTITWLTLYALLITGTVVTIGFIQHILGDRTPFALISWMPYRLPNQVAVILLATVLGLLCKTCRTAALGCHAETQVATTGATGEGACPTLAALLFLTVRPLIAHFMPESSVARYLYATEGILFFFAGVAIGQLVALTKGARLISVPIFAAALGALAAYHQFGAACAAAGLVSYLWTTQRSHTSHSSHTSHIAALCVTALIPLLITQWQTHQHLPVGDFERQIKMTLAERGDPHAMLVAPHWSIDLQEKTDHPILYTYETPQFVTYMPSLAPTIEKIQSDVYDIRFAQPWDYKLEAWQTRSREEWQRLGREFDFGYVIAPKALKLDLTPLVEGLARTLYAVK